jgi:hypothetical protein
VIRLPSSEQCFDADEQLCECERFREIIIRPCFEVFHFIVHGIARRQYDDWYSGIMASQPRNEFRTAKFRKHQIYDQKVIGRFQSHFEPGPAISSIVYREPFRFESECHKSHNFFFVFNNQ